MATYPNSLTTPQAILDRYQALVNSSLWTNQDDYLLLDAVSFKGYSPDEYAKQIHYSRQRHFYAKCMSQLRQEGQSWTILIDTDEYILYNAHVRDPTLELQPFRQHKTIYATLEQAYTNILRENERQGGEQPYYCDNLERLGRKIQNNPCLLIPRLLFGTKEETSSPKDIISKGGFLPNELKKTFDFHYLLTLTWRWHAKRSGKQVRLNGFPKGI
jgi:hypothetical protein